MMSNFEKLKSLFVADPQEDCDCLTETYDAENNRTVFYLENGKVKKQQCFADRIVLPMSESPITYEQLSNLVVETILHAENRSLTISSEYPHTYQKIVCASGQNFKAQRYKNLLELDGLPKNTVYLLPDIEFFGCITWNRSRYGAFCYPTYVFKKEIHANI